MKNILPHAYFTEATWLVMALSAEVLVIWMATSTWQDREKLRAYVKGHKGFVVPFAYFSQANGNYRAELWRVGEVTLILGVAAFYTLFHSHEGQPVEFWNFWENVAPIRLLANAITACKVGSALTARWHRRDADILDGQ
jgi:hypothetical protein